MTTEEIIRLAREAGVFSGANEKVFSESLERFAALVASAKQEEIESTLLRLHEQAADRHNYFQHAVKVIRGEI